MEREWNSADWEMATADVELQQLLWLSLDRCLKAGAREDDLKLLAWQCGLTTWKPTKEKLNG